MTNLWSSVQLIEQVFALDITLCLLIKPEVLNDGKIR